MTQDEYLKQRNDFVDAVDHVRLVAYAETGYEWIVCPKTGGGWFR